MSSISSLSSSTGYLPAASSQNNAAQRRADFQQIVQDLQNNDLSGAQQAYSALTQTSADTSTVASLSGSSGTSSTSSVSGSSPLDALGQALQNNDLSGAQQALAKLKQAHHGGGHHHHGGDASMQASTSASSAGATSSSTAEAGIATLPAGSIIDTSV